MLKPRTVGQPPTIPEAQIRLIYSSSRNVVQGELWAPYVGGRFNLPTSAENAPGMEAIAARTLYALAPADFNLPPIISNWADTVTVVDHPPTGSPPRPLSQEALWSVVDHGEDAWYALRDSLNLRPILQRLLHEPPRLTRHLSLESVPLYTLQRFEALFRVLGWTESAYKRSKWPTGRTSLLRGLLRALDEVASQFPTEELETGPSVVGNSSLSPTNNIPFVVDEELANALTSVGLFHGSVLVGGDEFEEDLDDSNPYASPLGGLYITPRRDFANYYAETSLWRQQGLTDQLSEGEQTIHRIQLLAGAEIALDEDIFGAYDAVKHWEHNQPFWPLYGIYGVTRELMAVAGILNQVEEEIARTIQLEPEEDVDPDDFRSEIELWTLQYAKPVFDAWLQLYRETATYSLPPEFRILNDKFVADPPLR